MVVLLDYLEAEKMLRKYGIKTARSAYIKSGEEAVSFSGGKPIVMKVLSQQALHKSKSGLVKLNLYNEDKIIDAFSYLEKQAKALKLKDYRILAQEMAPNGIEIIVGGKTDPQFGKLILLGLGGIYVEAFKDVALRVCPISSYDAKSMISQLKSRSIIASSPESASMVESLLMRASKMIMENDISELDLNPIILHSNGYVAVDLRVMK
ncbi:MAG: acetate--CoA ligase family protein [Candidatus Micrarchaeia archaeon]